MHELEPDQVGTGPRADQAAINVATWRKSQRKRLIDARMAIPAHMRAQATERIAERLDHETGNPKGRIVAIYWPFRGEPDLRQWGGRAMNRGARLALPVVVAMGKPLVFRSWMPGEKLEKGVWNIPVPAAGKETLPDIVIAPLVGFDEAGFRLGYGGGFYDRTLAALPAKPLTIGVAFACARLETIYPQWHDIPMDRLVIEGI